MSTGAVSYGLHRVPARSNHWLSDRVAGQMLRDLATAGVNVQRYRPSMLHAKCLLVDDDLAAVGSANFNARSLFLDFEVTALLHGETYNRRMAAWFDETIAASDPGPPIARGTRVPIEAAARLLAPFVSCVTLRLPVRLIVSDARRDHVAPARDELICSG